MLSNRLLCCVALLVVLHPAISALGVQKSGGGPTKDSSLTVIGSVSGTLDLVRADKLTANVRTLPNGDKIAELPQRSEYYVGTIYKFQIDEVVRGNKTIRSGQSINVLILGPGSVSHRVVLSAQRKYLLQLSLLDVSEKYKGTVVMDLAQPSGAKQPFDSQNVFMLIGDINSAVPVTKDTKELVKRIRREAKKK